MKVSVPPHPGSDQRHLIQPLRHATITGGWRRVASATLMVRISALALFRAAMLP